MAFLGQWVENANAGQQPDALSGGSAAGYSGVDVALRDRADRLMRATLRQVALVVLLGGLFAVAVAVFFTVEGFAVGAALFGAIGAALAGIAVRFATRPLGS